MSRHGSTDGSTPGCEGKSHEKDRPDRDVGKRRGEDAVAVARRARAEAHRAARVKREGPKWEAPEGRRGTDDAIEQREKGPRPERWDTPDHSSLSISLYSIIDGEGLTRLIIKFLNFRDRENI